MNSDFEVHTRVGRIVGARIAGVSVASDAEEEIEIEEVCVQCGRDLHGYVGPLCRYCDGTAGD